MCARGKAEQNTGGLWRAGSRSQEQAASGGPPCADAGSLHSVDEEGAEAPALQDVQGVDGGPAGRADIVPQLAWVLFGVQQHPGGPLHQREPLTAAGHLSCLQATVPNPSHRAPADSPPSTHRNGVRPGKEQPSAKHQEKH